MKGKFIPEIPGENVGKKYPDPDRPEIKFPDPTRPENILKNVPRPRTGFGPVRSGETRGFGLPRRSLLCTEKQFLCYNPFVKIHIEFDRGSKLYTWN